MRGLFWGLLLCALAACNDQTPIRIGFLGGTSGRYADMGAAGRNGAQLAIDEQNARGGIHGRLVQLVAEDDRQDALVGEQALRRMQRAGVKVVIGPLTSSVATATVSLASESGMLLVSPTVTTSYLSGKDDQFIRVVADVQTAGAYFAEILRSKRSVKKVVLLADSANADYSLSWAKVFSASFVAHGGDTPRLKPFDSRMERGYERLAEEVNGLKPEMVVLITSATDAALLAQKLKSKNPAVQLAGTGWAATRRLIELGGQAVEGMIAEQYYNPRSTTPAFQRFHQDYQKRFGEDPGFSGTLSYDAAKIVMAGLEESLDGRPLKEALLKKQRFTGLQDEFMLDDFGDAHRRRYVTFVRNGEFELLE